MELARIRVKIALMFTVLIFVSQRSPAALLPVIKAHRNRCSFCHSVLTAGHSVGPSSRASGFSLDDKAINIYVSFTRYDIGQ